MDAFGTGLSLLWGGVAGGFAAYLASVASDVTYVTLADGRRQERRIPVLFKALLPFVPNFTRLLARPAFGDLIAHYADLLRQTGCEGLLSGAEFVALKLMLLWFLPDVWLYAERRRRHAEIQRALPFVLDAMTLSVEAGMDFIGALQRNCSRTRKLDALSEELLRMTKEIQLGASRQNALRAMADRVKQPDLRALALALIQGDELGVSIGEMLRIQAEQMRSRRCDYAERLAAEAPVKMLGPLLLCIFPAVFIILLGPIVSQALKGVW